MDKEFKQAWLDALRSKKYKKGIYKLRGFDDRYCCLGVLCDISNKGKWESHRQDPTYDYMAGSGHSNGFIPESLRESFGISNDQMYELSSLNDKNNTWDKAIAYIENNL